MIVCAHIPVSPYAPPSQTTIATFPYYSLFATYSMISEETLLQKLWTYQNLIMWVSGHVHRNAITNQPPAKPTPTVPSLYYGDLTHAFWEVETPSLRDFPQQFRTFDIVCNSDATVSIFATDVDPAVADGSPAALSRTYGVGALKLFKLDEPAHFGDITVPALPLLPTGSCNAELVVPLSPEMQAKLRGLGT